MENLKEKQTLVFRVGMTPTDSNKKVGPIRTHLYNYAFAKSEVAKGNNSKIIFRVDDTHTSQQNEEKTAELFQFFSNILGFAFDVHPYNAEREIGQSVFQSKRQAIYKQYIDELMGKQVAIMDQKTKQVLFDICKFIDLYSKVIEIHDLLGEKIKFNIEEHLNVSGNFFPLTRSDGSVLYNLASVVDDELFGITHIVRGQDKISVVQFQEMVREALDFLPKKYLHTPMFLDSEGKLLKGNVSFDDFLRGGMLPAAFISYTLSSGYGNPDEIYLSLEDFIATFDFKKIHKSNGQFDQKKLQHINKKISKKITSDDYLTSLLLYLEKVGEEKLYQKIRADQELQSLILSLLKLPSENISLLKGVIEPTYESVREDMYDPLQKVFFALEKEKNAFPSAESLNLSKKITYDAMRWILVGTIYFPNIEEIHSYLKIKQILSPRIDHAKELFLDQKK